MTDSRWQGSYPVVDTYYSNIARGNVKAATISAGLIGWTENAQ